MIILPLRKKNTENLVETLAIFFKEWLKIEKWIGSSHMKIFVFKNIIDKIRSDVLCSNNTPTSSFSRRENSVSLQETLQNFQKTIYKIMNKVGDNIILTGLNYELFYKSILKFLIVLKELCINLIKNVFHEKQKNIQKWK